MFDAVWRAEVETGRLNAYCVANDAIQIGSLNPGSKVANAHIERGSVFCGIVGKYVLEEFVAALPEEFRGRRCFEHDPFVVWDLHGSGLVMEVRRTEFVVILVSVPATVEPHIRVGVVDPELVVGRSEFPVDLDLW